MNPEDIVFSVHEYDSDGDISESGIFIHFGTTRIKVANNIDEMKKVVDRFSNIQKEIEENYSGSLFS